MSARDTLLEHLSARQRAEFEKTGGFTVRGRWGRRYYLDPHTTLVRGRLASWYGNSGNVWDYHYIPADDIVLALKLLLESNERVFRMLACRAR